MVSLDGKLYIVGGKTSSKAGHKVMSEVSEYDIEAKAWGQTGELAVAVEAAPAVIISDKVSTVGLGYNNHEPKQISFNLLTKLDR